eukprot:ctg_1093.g455
MSVARDEDAQGVVRAEERRSGEEARRRSEDYVSATVGEDVIQWEGLMDRTGDECKGGRCAPHLWPTGMLCGSLRVKGQSLRRADAFVVVWNRTSTVAPFRRGYTTRKGAGQRVTQPEALAGRRLETAGRWARRQLVTASGAQLATASSLRTTSHTPNGSLGVNSPAASRRRDALNGTIPYSGVAWHVEYRVTDAYRGAASAGAVTTRSGRCGVRFGAGGVATVDLPGPGRLAEPHIHFGHSHHPESVAGSVLHIPAGALVCERGTRAEPSVAAGRAVAAADGRCPDRCGPRAGRRVRAFLSGATGAARPAAYRVRLWQLGDVADAVSDGRTGDVHERRGDAVVDRPVGRAPPAGGDRGAGGHLFGAPGAGCSHRGGRGADDAAGDGIAGGRGDRFGAAAGSIAVQRVVPALAECGGGAADAGGCQCRLRDAGADGVVSHSAAWPSQGQQLVTIRQEEHGRRGHTPHRHRGEQPHNDDDGGGGGECPTHCPWPSVPVAGAVGRAGRASADAHYVDAVPAVATGVVAGVTAAGRGERSHAGVGHRQAVAVCDPAGGLHAAGAEHRGGLAAARRCRPGCQDRLPAAGDLLARARAGDAFIDGVLVVARSVKVTFACRGERVWMLRCGREPQTASVPDVSLCEDTPSCGT